MSARSQTDSSAAKARRTFRGPLRNDLTAAAAGFVTYLVTTGGLFYYAGEIQLPLLVGLVVGLLASKARTAAAAALASFALAALVLPPVTLQPVYADGRMLLVSLGMSVLAACFAFAVRWLVDRRGASAGKLLLYSGLALILLNLWVTSLVVVGLPYSGSTSILDVLSTPTVPGTAQTDDQVYLRTQQLMDSGVGFYRAYAQAHSENTEFLSAPPGSVLGFRPPLIFKFRDLVAGPLAERLIAGLLVWVSVAALVVFFALKENVRAPLMLLAVAALSTYFMSWVTTAMVVYVDAWAAVLGLAAFGFIVHALRSPSRRAAYVIGVAAATLAVLSRELMLFLPLAGLVSALAEKEERKFRVSAWATSLVIAAIGLGLHYRAASRFLSDKPGQASLWLSGGVDKLALAVRFGTPFVAPKTWVLVLLVGLAFAGLAYLLVRRRSVGLFAAIAVALPLIGFLFVSNEARGPMGSANYWGVIVVPLMLAVIPLAFAWLSGPRKDLEQRSGS